MLKTIFLFIIASASLSFAQHPASVTIENHSDLIISRHIYGHFSEHLGRCIYDGFWVDSTLPVAKKDRLRLDIIDALKKIHIPNLRCPGGCFADEYHWRDGIGPPLLRPKMVNTNWGGVTEDNSFGTHEFLELCGLLGCEPYIVGNVGSGSVEEMSKWVEYLNCNGVSEMTTLRKQNGSDSAWKVGFFGIGNESWGCGGNMTPEFYADQYNRYSSFTKDYPGAPLKKIVSGAYKDNYKWTEVCMKKIDLDRMWGLSLHYYIFADSYEKKGSATQFDEARYFSALEHCLHLDEVLTHHSAIMDKYDPAKKVALVVDEWGIWTDPEPGTNPAFLQQQNSLRDALIAATTLNMFNNHCDRIRMANLAQTVNVLQALILTDKEEMLLTPTYHVFDMFKVHQDAAYLPIHVNSPDYVLGDKKIKAVNVSASEDTNKTVHISFVNLDPANMIKVNVNLAGITWQIAEGEVLTSSHFTDINTFDKPNTLAPQKFTAMKKQGNDLIVELPPKSVVVVAVK